MLWYLGVVSVSKGEGPWYRFIQDRDLYLSPQNTVAIVTMLIITLEMFITSMKYVSKWNGLQNNYNTKSHPFSSRL